MTEREEIKKEIRKAVREVFMKYKRGGLWQSPGYYEYHFDHFRIPFSMTIGPMSYGGYVLFDYENGASFRLDPLMRKNISQKEFEMISRDLNSAGKEMNTAAALWRNFYKMKFGRNR